MPREHGVVDDAAIGVPVADEQHPHALAPVQPGSLTQSGREAGGEVGGSARLHGIDGRESRGTVADGSGRHGDVDLVVEQHEPEGVVGTHPGDDLPQSHLGVVEPFTTHGGAAVQHHHEVRGVETLGRRGLGGYDVHQDDGRLGAEIVVLHPAVAVLTQSCRDVHVDPFAVAYATSIMLEADRITQGA